MGVFSLFYLGCGGLCEIWVLFMVVSMVLIWCLLFFGLCEGSSYGGECLTSQPVLCWSSIAFYCCIFCVSRRGIVR